MYKYHKLQKLSQDKIRFEVRHRLQESIMQGNSRDYYTCKPPSNMFVLLEIRPHCPFYSVKPSSPSPPPCIFTPLPETSVITTAGCTLACVFRWFLYKQTPPPPLTHVYISYFYTLFLSQEKCQSISSPNPFSSLYCFSRFPKSTWFVSMHCMVLKVEGTFGFNGPRCA